MKASEFFRNEIKDNKIFPNSYNLESIETGKYTENFNCEIGRETEHSSYHRKQGILEFLSEINTLIGRKTLTDFNIITFDDEFDANKQQRIFEINGNEFENVQINTSNIVGSILYKGYHFNINCRFGNDFLQYMIANTSGFLELENFGVIDKDLGLGEWILIYYWKLQLKKAFVLGLYKTYQRKKENLSTVRGSININAMLKKTYFDGKTDCAFQEHSYDNELNTVISMALKKVFKSKYQAIVSDVYEIKNAYDALNLAKINLNKLSNQNISNPYFKRYKQVYDLSLKILKNEFANIGEQNTDFSAFLFDISLLFEHHIRKVLKQKFTLFPKNKDELFLPNGVGYNKIYPDIIIDFGDRKIGVYDVKYKHFNTETGVNREDRFQITSYVATHLAQYEVVECGIIYPLKESNFDKKGKIQNQNLEVSGYKIPFKIRFYEVYSNIENQSQSDKFFLELFDIV